ncbi:hypothetical protein LCGC14_1983160, partial [marine sediment metagenome]
MPRTEEDTINTEQRITYSVGFKAVIDLVNSGEVEFETNDIVAETIELSDAFYEALAVRLGLAPLGADGGKSSRKRTRTSAKRDSNRSGSTDRKKSTGPKDPNADATPAQIKFLKKLLGENDIDYDYGFDLDDEEYFFDEFTMGSIQKPIEALKGQHMIY